MALHSPCSSLIGTWPLTSKTGGSPERGELGLRESSNQPGLGTTAPLVIMLRDVVPGWPSSAGGHPVLVGKGVGTLTPHGLMLKLKPNTLAPDART